MAKIKDKALLEYLMLAGILLAGIGLLFFLLRDSFDLIFSMKPIPVEKLQNL